MKKEQNKKPLAQTPGAIKPKKANLLEYPDLNKKMDMFGEFNPTGQSIEDMEDMDILDNNNWNCRELHEIIFRDEFNDE